ncbi:MAG: PilZ domain-containing protein [Treponema sp.]|nr:PilZ domain-containing protein [Treponema sp.]
MKLLLVLGSDETHRKLKSFAQSLGIEIIRYYHVIKAMDNVDEIDPGAIIISAKDFPRHWKTMVQFVRTERSKDDCPIVILAGSRFPAEENSKASHLGVNGIFAETLGESEELQRLGEILGNRRPQEERRKGKRLQAEPSQRFGFVFVHPLSQVLVPGNIRNISSGGISFLPDNPALTLDLSLQDELNECSLRCGDFILSPLCRIVKVGGVLSIEFAGFPRGEQELLTHYLEGLS